MPSRGSKHRNLSTHGLVNPGSKVVKRKSNHDLHEGNHTNDKTERDPPHYTSALPLRQQANGTTHPSSAGGEVPAAPEPVPATPTSRHHDSRPVTMVEHNRHTPARQSSSTIRSFTVAATTILTSCPQRDVMAMLILLLQLSPPILFAVDFLFALMTTYVPRPSGTFFSMPSLQGWFEGAGGTPSTFTVVLIDVLFFTSWMFLPRSLKTLGLDLAQAVIALSFSGATSGQSGLQQSMLLCIVYITAFRVLGNKQTRQRTVHHIMTRLLRQNPDHLGRPPDGAWSGDFILVENHSFLRTIVGVHILAQGVLRLIRRTLQANKDASPDLKPLKRSDPEAGTVFQPVRTNSIPFDGKDESAVGSVSDMRQSGQTLSNEVEKQFAGKKKRKQATLVRSQQPFWAALAHTKVTVSNQMEQSHLSMDQSEAHATGPHHIGDANFRAEANRVWIDDIGSTEIGFGVILLSDEAREAGREVKGNAHHGVDGSRPFYVRVNGAPWASIRAEEEGANGGQDGDDMVRVWQGDISGLTAHSHYYCEFVRSSDDVVLCTTSFITQPAPYTEPTVAPSNSSALRPASPATTIRNSIAAAKLKLEEHRNKAARNKKAQKSSLAQARKELETLTHRLQSAGSQDERMRQRALQLRQSMKHSDEAVLLAESESQDLGEIPEEELDEHRDKRREWQTVSERNGACRAELEAVKTRHVRECQHVEDQLNSARLKRDRLLARQGKLQAEFDRLKTANVQDADVKQKREAERQFKVMQRASTEQQYIQHIQQYENAARESRAKTVHAIAQSQHLETLMLTNSHMQPQFVGHRNRVSTPTTPEGQLPGTNGPRPPSHQSNHQAFTSSFQFPELSGNAAEFFPPATGGASGGTFHAAQRGRSSSMLSDMSNFTDEVEEQPAPSGFNGVQASTVLRQYANGDGLGGSGLGNGFSSSDGNGNSIGNGSGYANGHGNINGYPNGSAHAYALNGLTNGRAGSLGGSSSSGTGSASGSQRDPMSPPAKVISPVGTTARGSHQLSEAHTG